MLSSSPVLFHSILHSRVSQPQAYVTSKPCTAQRVISLWAFFIAVAFSFPKINACPVTSQCPVTLQCIYLQKKDCLSAPSTNLCLIIKHKFFNISACCSSFNLKQGSKCVMMSVHTEAHKHLSLKQSVKSCMN